MRQLANAAADRATRARAVLKRLEKLYPKVECALKYRDAYELLAATILSAQCTDQRVNETTPALFKRFPDPQSLATANPLEVEELVRPTGFYRNKTKNLIGMGQALVENFAGEVPRTMEQLTTIPGVGRKTANVVLSVAFNEPGLPVDTHVTRLSNLLGLVDNRDAVKIEMILNEYVPPKKRGEFSLRLIEHGRQVCVARRPQCDKCGLAELCPSAFRTWLN